MLIHRGWIRNRRKFRRWDLLSLFDGLVLTPSPLGFPRCLQCWTSTHSIAQHGKGTLCFRQGFTPIVTTGKRVVIKGNIAVAEGPDGQRAQVQKIGEKGGIATAGKHKWAVWLIEWPEDTTVTNEFRAQLRTSEAGNEKHAFLKADGQYDLDTVAKGSLKNLEVAHPHSSIDPYTPFRILYSKLITINTISDWILTLRTMTQELETSHTLIR